MPARHHGFAVFLLMGAYLVFAPSQADDAMLNDDIEQGYLKHGALAQLHRWYLLYEEPRYGIDNALDILSDDVRISSGLGEANGHEQYAERVQQLPTSWRNAHDVHEPRVTVQPDGAQSLTTDITYQNVGLLDDGAVRTAELTYTMSLEPGEGVLPVFTDIEIAQNSEGIADSFVPRYADNRLLSLIHYWLALIEDPARDPQPVREILAENFVLDFSSGAITDFDGFEAWLAGPGSQVAASTHRIEDFAYQTRADGRYRATMTFDWEGLLPDGTRLIAKTRHGWTVVDDPSERFGRIERMDVEVVEPFRTKPEAPASD